MQHFCFCPHFSWAELKDLQLCLCTQKAYFSQIFFTNLSKSVLVSTSLLPRLSIHPHRCGISRCWFDSMIMTAWLWLHDSMMTAVRRRNRLEWANAHIQWHLALWRGVLFMDEFHWTGQMTDRVYGVVWVSGFLMSTLWIEWPMVAVGLWSVVETYSSKSIISFQINVVWVRGVRYDDFWLWTIKMSPRSAFEEIS